MCLRSFGRIRFGGCTHTGGMEAKGEIESTPAKFGEGNGGGGCQIQFVSSGFGGAMDNGTVHPEKLSRLFEDRAVHVDLSVSFREA
ncbi:hypothetical protein BaRGS_00032212 [Batillaria attramentaria]|uniref:Uncharacterized protein n=1 Tax=Batillaria attramentaria TaxID=370345 RepID=A0ABD0JNM9_9CAEN